VNRHVNSVAGRLSLRPPQRDALEILGRVSEIISLTKGADPQTALQTIRSEYASVEDFERDFPSVCFALATGVGKTRLMGAFISYLRLAKRIQHFFVLAPNLTIYNKLIADFSPGSPKYVFQGIAEFATTPPEIITGDNYESGRGVRGLFYQESVHVNIFNISKINSEVRGGKAPRIKRLSEYIGESYFDYLAGLNDLVLLMDESHRYRASAGIRAINELKPVLGLEVTATPYVEAGPAQIPFKNVIYTYPLAQAMADGFVKEPAVATKENFDPSAYSPEELERVKLEDGVLIHEEAKVRLETYARENDVKRIKPFMLVVARDTQHADSLVKIVQADEFFGGRYRDRVVTVHSNQQGSERDDTVQRLLAVENPDESTEIVVHVNMLKEGWDVTNLYTIVPLRAANSRTLVEQSIGRGLRLPYGKRTGVGAVDRLTVVAHDRFQDIIDEANRPDSIVKKIVIIGKDVAVERQQVVTVEPAYVSSITGAGDTKSVFATPAEQAVARTTLEVVRTTFESLPRSDDLRKPEVKERLLRLVEAAQVPPGVSEQGTLEGFIEPIDLRPIIDRTVELFVERSIDVPRIVVLPRGQVTTGFRDFDLDTSSIHLQPVAQDILIHHLRTNARERITAGAEGQTEARLEDYLVRGLIDFEYISYADHADLLYKLAGQMVEHLLSYLADDEEVRNVLRFHERTLVQNIHAQMEAYAWESATDYDYSVSKGFVTLRSASYAAPAGEHPRDFRAPVDDKQYMRNILFGGFRRCLFPVQKFDSDTERRFAVLLESEADNSLKWFKPTRGVFFLYYGRDSLYEPDFVVETKTAKYVCEPKQRRDMEDGEVLAKARVAAIWCERATVHELAHGGKPWSYLLVPHDEIIASANLAGLAARFTHSAPPAAAAA